MNILFICDEYPPGPNGGIGSATQAFARALVKMGHRVFVVGLYPVGYGSADYEEDMGVCVWRLRYHHGFLNHSWCKKVKRNLPLFIKRKLNGYRAYTEFVTFLQKLITEQKIDIIEMPDWNTFIYDIGIEEPLPNFGIPLVVKFHCSRSYLNKELGIPSKKRWFEIDKHIFFRGEALVAVSAYAAQQTNELFWANRKIEVIYNGVELAPNPINELRADSTVFFSGTLVPNKGVYSLMKAWNIVAAAMPEAKLLVFGKGSIEPLQALLKNENKESVVFKGHRPKQELLAALSTATLAVFPSYTEAFSMAPLESMSVGCPTIFTERSSGKEVIQDGVDGFLVDPDNIEEIASKILLILRDKTLQNRIGQKGRLTIREKFHIQVLVKKQELFYQDVIESFAKK